MKTLGVLGGISPESTLIYYRQINAGIRARRGGVTSAELILHSVDYGRIHDWQAVGDWAAIAAHLRKAARGLEACGVEAVLLACNTVHKVAGEIESGLGVPFLHIVDSCADALLADGRAQPALLGTRHTMDGTYFTDRLAAHGLAPVLPDAAGRDTINTIIFDELTQGLARPESAAAACDVIARMQAGGADSVILGCTELGMILDASNSPLPVYDTALIHCRAAVDFALA